MLSLITLKDRYKLQQILTRNVLIMAYITA